MHLPSAIDILLLHEENTNTLDGQYLQSAAKIACLAMCRSIKPLFNFDPPATDDEIRAASLQFVRKVSGFQKPSKVNETVFEETVERVMKDMQYLLDGLQTTSASKNREVEKERAQQRAAKRFSR